MRSSPPSSRVSATSFTRSFSAPIATASAPTRPRDESRRLGSGNLPRFRRPDVGAPHLAGAGQYLGSVHVELRLRKSGGDQSRTVFVDRDRARDAARPGVELLLDRWSEGLQLDHVGN